MLEAEAWGQSRDGYTGGGNFDSNPDLKVYTLKKYYEMKEKGELSSLGQIDETTANAKRKMADYQSQLLTENSIDGFADGSIVQFQQSDVGKARRAKGDKKQAKTGRSKGNLSAL